MGGDNEVLEELNILVALRLRGLLPVPAHGKTADQVDLEVRSEKLTQLVRARTVTQPVGPADLDGLLAQLAHEVGGLICIIRPRCERPSHLESQHRGDRGDGQRLAARERPPF